MSTKRVSLLTISSLTALSKVCSSCYSSDSVKTLNLLRNLSTATERLDFCNSNGYQIDNSSEFFQNSSGLYSESQNPTDLPQKSSGQSLNPNGGFRECPSSDLAKNPVGKNGNLSGYYGRNHGDSQKNSIGHFQNSGGAYRERISSENQNNIVEHVRNFNGNYGQNSGVLHQNLNGAHAKSSGGFEQSSYGVHHNHSGISRVSTRNEFQNNPIQQNGNSSGYNGYNGGRLQPNPNGAHAQNSWGVHHNMNGLNSQGSVESQGSLNGDYRQSVWQSHRSPSDHYRGNVGVYQHGPNVYQPNPSAGQYQQSPSAGQYQQSPNVGQYQESPNVGQYHHNASVGGYQQNPNVGGYQQNTNVGQSQQNTNVGQYQQNQNVGLYEPNSNDFQNIMLASQVSNPMPEGELAESTESSPYSGTLDELDGFLKEGKVKEAVEVLVLLEKQNVLVNLPRLLQLMHLCGEAKALQEAKAVHEHIIKSLSPLKVSTYNRILEMYSKCGSMDDAVDVFNKMQERNLTSWDTMITWLAKNGLGEDAIDIFTQFKKAGLKPDGQMFIGVFTACSVLGDIDEGMLHFESMNKEYGIVPSIEHYVSVVDMLGSSGYLDEALEFVEKMPLEPSADVWETLMNCCRVHGHLELGDRCAELVEQLDPSHLNEQSKAGLVPVKASDIAKDKEKKKVASQNLLEVRSRVHEYRAGDTSHPENDKIYSQLRGLREQMKEAGYIPETRFVLHDIDQEGKEEALLAHSERLAVAYGLLSSPTRSPIRVIKNLRVCGDCHTALKIISKLVGRELIIRDAKRFHHFKHGLCSCRDYW